MRKTIEVDKVRKMVNHANEHGTASPEFREGHNAILSSILMQTDNYKGFGYVSGYGPTIFANDNTTTVNANHDASRRIYY